jgi:hypothetical protein
LFETTVLTGIFSHPGYSLVFFTGIYVTLPTLRGALSSSVGLNILPLILILISSVSVGLTP